MAPKLARSCTKVRVVSLLFVFVVSAIALGVVLGVVIFQKDDNSGSSSQPEQNGAESGDSSDITTPALDDTPRPTLRGSASPSYAPTSAPTSSPSARPTLTPILPITTFYTIADVPYDEVQKEFFSALVDAVPDDADVVVHLGDLKNGDPNCNEEKLMEVEDVLQNSPVPTFLLVGDNEYNDCRSPDEALLNWRAYFSRFDAKYWNHDLIVKTMPGRNETFFFYHKNTLFFGLNIVSGDVHSNAEWKDRLSTQFLWLTGAANATQMISNNPAQAIVILGHGIPGRRKDRFFFEPLRDYIRDVLMNAIPVIYISADKHEFRYQPNFFGLSNFLYITIEGGVDAPPTRFVVNASETQVNDTLTVERFWEGNDYVPPGGSTSVNDTEPEHPDDATP